MEIELERNYSQILTLFFPPRLYIAEKNPISC